MLILRSKHAQRALIQTMSHFIHLQATYCFACKLGAVLKTPTGLTPKYCQAWISELPSFTSLKFHKTLKFIYSEALEFDNTEHSGTHLSHTRSSNCIHLQPPKWGDSQTVPLKEFFMECRGSSNLGSKYSLRKWSPVMYLLLREVLHYGSDLSVKSHCHNLCALSDSTQINTL